MLFAECNDFGFNTFAGPIGPRPPQDFDWNEICPVFMPWTDPTPNIADEYFVLPPMLMEWTDPTPNVADEYFTIPKGDCEWIEFPRERTTIKRC